MLSVVATSWRGGEILSWTDYSEMIFRQDGNHGTEIGFASACVICEKKEIQAEEAK